MPQNSLHLVGKALVEHAVGFVQHQGAHTGQGQSVMGHDIEQAARRGHNNVSAAAQTAQLGLYRHTAKNDTHFDAIGQTLGQAFEYFAYLNCQFTGGRQYQRSSQLGPFGLVRSALCGSFEQGQDIG